MGFSNYCRYQAVLITHVSLCLKKGFLLVKLKSKCFRFQNILCFYSQTDIVSKCINLIFFYYFLQTVGDYIYRSICSVRIYLSIYKDCFQITLHLTSFLVVICSNCYKTLKKSDSTGSYLNNYSKCA